MSDPRHHDEDVRAALHDAVDDVEPAYRLDEIRARTTRQQPTEEGTMNDNARTWLVGAGGAVLATAAVIVTVAVLGGGDGGDDTPTAGEPSTTASAEPSPSAPTTTPEPSPTPDGTGGPDGGGTEVTVPVYYTVDTTAGPRLVREFRRVGAPGDAVADRVAAALDAAVSLPPADPDYATLWPADTTVTAGARTGGGRWLVSVESGEVDLRQRPGDIDAATAEVMRQQLVMTTQAVLQDRAAVDLLATVDSEGNGDILGAAGDDTGADDLVLALMNVTNPVEGQTVSGDTLRADGRNNGFEASVGWEIRVGDADGEVVDRGATQAAGWDASGALFPWEVDIDVSDLEPGTYVFVARNDDPTGGTEGVGDSADTKTFVVE